ncbi:snaclec trimecetin subunit beta-like [Patiria miniata]|uniref:C-type lectin domain-containing protein n=1 Tax=Patiria miniata TaxID=46514 RepID=A0A914AL18_PATMI|nr:snaclec trimecetin subunit beta-like [Patiria miniata]
MISRYNHLTVLLLIFDAVFSSAAVCSPGWTNWKQSCYAMHSKRLNWMDATKFCENTGSHIVVPNSQAENDFIWGLVMDRLEYASLPMGGVWIGCKRETADSSFVCAEKTDFTNWTPGHPSAKVLCIVYGKGGNGTWRSNRCTNDSRRYVVCEMPNTAYCLTAGKNGRFVSGLP